MSSDISRLSSRVTNTFLNSDVQTQEAIQGNTINQGRGENVIRNQSEQPSHIVQNHELENVRNGDTVDKICNGIIKVFSGLGRILGALFKGIGKMAAAILGGVLDLIKSLTEKLKGIVNYSRSEVIPLATNTAQGITEGACAAGQIMGAVYGAPVIAAGGGAATILPSNPTDDQNPQNA